MNDEHPRRPRRRRGVRGPSLPAGQPAARGPAPGGWGSTCSSDSDSRRRFPPPSISIYMGIVSIAILAYVSSSEERRDGRLRPARPVHDGASGTRALLGATVVAIPALAAANVYVQMNVPLQPPLFSRTVHPASPSEITVHDKKIDLDAGENPFRHLETSNPAEFRKHVESGRQVYYRNCVFCHGDNMAGNGMFVHGLDPIPTNFTDPGRSPMLRETFLFWRISKGGPGLPEEGGPWDTAMPAWEKFLKEEEMWDAILFLYDFTGQRPRGQGGGAPRNDLLSDRSARGRATRRGVSASCSRAVCRADGIGARGGSRRRDRCAAGVGQAALSASTVRSATARRGTAKATPPRTCCPRPRNFTTRQVQGSDDAQRRAPDPPGPRQHHQARHALHVDAGLARHSPTRKCRISRTSSRPSLPTSRSPRASPQPVALPSAPKAHEGVDRAREEALRGDRLRQVPRHARPRRRTLGADPDGRLGPSDPRRPTSRRAGPSGEARPARISSGR